MPVINSVFEHVKRRRAEVNWSVVIEHVIWDEPD